LSELKKLDEIGREERREVEIYLYHFTPNRRIDGEDAASSSSTRYSRHLGHYRYKLDLDLF